MPSQMSLMLITTFPDGYVPSRFLSPSGLRRCHLTQGIALIFHIYQFCAIAACVPTCYLITVIVTVWKCLSALVNFDKCNIRLKIIQPHRQNLIKIETNTHLWVSYRRKTRSKLSFKIYSYGIDVKIKQHTYIISIKMCPGRRERKTVFLKLFHSFT